MCLTPKTLALAVCLLLFPFVLARGEEPADAAVHHVVVIRISERAFDSIAGKAVDVKNPVDDVVLGTRVHGQSHTLGKIGVSIDPDHDDASFVFTFTGKTHAKTIGRNGPAIIHSHSATEFTCKKRVLFDLENGFHAGPAEIRSQTRMVTDDVQSDRPGIRGRLVRRVAWRRVRESHEEANAIASQHARREIVAGFDETTSARLQELNERVAIGELVGELFQGVIETEYSVSSTNKYIQLAVRRKGSPDVPVIIPEDEVADAGVQVWVHSMLIEPRVFDSFQTYAGLRKFVMPLMSVINDPARFPQPRLEIIRASLNLRRFDQPVFSRLAARRWSRERISSLVGWDTTDEWLVVGIRSADVVGRMASDGQDRQAVSAAR
jgi:hypothetical protein